MQLAKEAVTLRVASALKTVLVVVGIFIVASCLKFATDYRARVFESTPQSIGTNAREIQKQLVCLTRNIYWEAATEPFEGKVAVAQVTLNRMESGKFADSVCGVVYQKTSFNSKTVCQFSWFCESNHLVKSVYKPLYKESEEVAKMVLLEGFRLPNMKEALYYHADYVNPRWNKPRISQIGRHIFYKERDNV